MIVRKRLLRWFFIAALCLLSVSVHAGIVLSQGQVPVAELEGLCSSENITVNGTTITCSEGSFDIEDRTITANEPFELIASNDFNVSNSEIGDNEHSINLTAQYGKINIEEAAIGGNLSAQQNIDVESSNVAGNVDSQYGKIEIDDADIGGNLSAQKNIDVESSNVAGNVDSQNGKVDLEEATVAGSVTAQKKIEIKDNSTVNGNVTSQYGSIKLDDSSTVLGTCTPETEGCQGQTGELAEFQIQSPDQASVCFPAQIVLRAVGGDNNPVKDYQGRVNLTTSAGHGNWQKVSAAGALTPNPDNDDDGQAFYQFVAADDGAVTLGLANTRADRLTIRAEDTSGGQFGVSSVVDFRENAIVVSMDDAFADDVIAGRPHVLQAEVLRRDPTDGQCGRVKAYNEPIELRAWRDRQADDPAAAAPTLDGGAGAVGLPSTRPGATNLTVNFSEGLASLQLSPSDVGHFAIELEDSESGLIVDENGGPLKVLGSSVPLSVRPFGLALMVPGNPEPPGNSTDGSGFQAAGRPFEVQVRAVQYQRADDIDANGQMDGQPEGHGDSDANNNANLNDNATAENFDAPVNIRGYLSAGPTDADDPGLAGLSGVSGFSNGSVTGSARYNEVGAIEVAAEFVSSYHGRDITLRGDSGPVGRFYPERFSLESQMDGVLKDHCNGFNYTGQSFGYDIAPDFTLEARAHNDTGPGPITRNYRGSWQKLTVTDFSRNDPISDVNQMGAESSLLEVKTTAGVATLTPNGDGTLVYQAGADTFIYTPDANALIASFVAELALEITEIEDSDLVAMPSAELPLLESTDPSIRYGRLVMENVYGPETPGTVLTMPFLVEFFEGGRFKRNTLDDGSADDDPGCSKWNADKVKAINSNEDSPPPPHYEMNTTGTGYFSEGRAELELEATGTQATDTLEWDLSDKKWLQHYWGREPEESSDDPAEDALQNPRATATFGVYRGNDRIIYWREVFTN